MPKVQEIWILKFEHGSKSRVKPVKNYSFIKQFMGLHGEDFFSEIKLLSGHFYLDM